MAASSIDLGLRGLRNVEIIGSGGSAIVYKAVRQVPGRFAMEETVAVKVLRSSWDTPARRRFEREQLVMNRLSKTAGFVPILETGETDDGSPYIIMPFYEGGSLQQRIARSGPIDWPRAVRLIEQVAQTLVEAHELDVFHRDIKPANILLSEAGRPHVADFGISLIADDAASRAASTAAFTPAYSPPESFTDGLLPVPATDIYGLAATLWAILAGHAPFKDPGERPAPVTVFGRVAMHQVGDLRDRVPSPICRFIERSMAKRPERRPASMADFLTELQAAREDAYRGVEVERLEVEPLLVSTRPEGDDPASNDPAGAAGDGFSGGGEESPASAHQDVDLTDAGSAQRNPAGGQSTVDPLAVETVPVVDVEGDEEETLAPGEPVDTWLVPAADDEVTITPEEREADGSDSSTETIEAEAETSDTDIDIDGDPGADTDIDIEGDPGIDRHGGGAGDRVGRDPVDVDGPADDAGDVDPVSNGYADLVRLGFLGDDDPAASETRLGRPVPVVFPGELTEPALKGTETDDSSDAAVVGPTGDGDVSTGSDWLGKVLVAAIVTLVLLLTAWWLFGLGSGAESGESDSALVVVDAGSTVAVAPLS